MSHDDLPLFKWQPPRQVIPFPTCFRVGHARKVAEQLDQARTNKEADARLTRACQTLRRQMRAAQISPEEIERQHETFLHMICAECERIRAKWTPDLSGGDHGTPPGAA
jgi:hypothetical protein